MSDIIETERYRVFALFYSNFSAMEGKGGGGYITSDGKNMVKCNESCNETQGINDPTLDS